MKDYLSVLTSGALFLTLAGCSEQPAADAPATDKGSAASADDHHGAGPHGGTVTDWGGGAYHVEFTVDHGKKETVVYVLGSDGKTAAPIAAERLTLSITDPAFQVDLAAQPLEGEADGKSSRFVGQHEDLGKVQEFAGTISGEVDGTPYAGDFQEEPGEHSHD